MMSQSSTSKQISSPALLNSAPLDFELSPELEASEPPEARGLARDEVRLMVSNCSDNRVVHTRFRSIGAFLNPGDLVVINTSGTMNAALSATRADIHEEHTEHRACEMGLLACCTCCVLRIY